MNTASSKPHDSDQTNSDEPTDEPRVPWYKVKRYYTTHLGERWVNFDYVRHLSDEIVYFKDGYDKRGLIIDELRQKIQELESRLTTSS